MRVARRQGKWRWHLSAAVLVAGASPLGAAAQATQEAVAAVPAPPAQEGPQPAAEPGRVTGRRTYDAAYFAPFSPTSALQMVQRVPGFSIEDVDPSVRGFGQAAGNVVINGQRPSAKSDTIETILQRIPASRVLRIEVGTGDVFGAEFAAKAQVVNVILTAGGGLNGSLEATVRRSPFGEILPEGSASALWKHGASTFNLSVQAFNRTSSEEGYDSVTTLPVPIEVEHRDKVNTIRDPNGSLSGSWALDGGTNRTAHVNARYAIDRFDLSQQNRVTFPTTPGAASRDDYLTQVKDSDEWELGGDVTRPLADGGLKLTALANRKRGDFRDLSIVNASAPTGLAQAVDEHAAETLARLTWSRAGWNGWNVEIGAEGALNTLTSKVVLESLDAGGGRTRIDLPVDDATVREWRGEAFVNAGHALSPTLRADVGLTGELSHLTVSGDVAAARTLSFLKPKLVLDWKPAPKWHAQLSIQRTVNQLQFEDFISSAELTNDRVNGGNANLLPQRSWEVLGTLERTILGDGLARFELGYTRISLVQDRIPTLDGFDAPGNLGSGDVLIARARVEAPLSKLGLPGGRLTLYGSLVPTRVRDPYTLRYRPFSGNNLFYGTAEFRQDLGAFAWGISAEGGTPNVAYRLDETDDNHSDVYVQAFAEWRPSAKTTLTLTAENLIDAHGYRDRHFYTPTRATPDPYLREIRDRRKGVVPALTFKRTF